MLQNLYVKNLALIDETEVEFGEGLNILTGETGAGKSILLGSVTLALGGKYNAQMLRNGAKSGLVELTFHIKEEKILKKLEALDIYPEDGYLTLSRRLLEGRSVSKINGETVNMSVLKDVASLLIDIHGQHDNQTLLHRKNHLTLLDLYGKEQTNPLKEKMASCYQEWKAVCKKVEQSSLDEESRRRELSLAEFEVNEIEEAALKEGEDEFLEEQYRKMTDSRKLTEGVAEAYQYTAEDERGNASDYLSRAIRSLQEAASFDEKGSQLYDQIVEIDSLLNDFNRDVSAYLSDFTFSEEEFYETEKYESSDNRIPSWLILNPNTIESDANTGRYFVSKYNQNGPMNQGIPLLRMTEIQYICAECQAEPAKGLDYLNTVRHEYGIPAAFDLTKENCVFEEELFKEYRKSFLAEGQLFFFLKRKDYTDIPGALNIENPRKIFCFPLPDDEKEFGNLITK